MEVCTRIPDACAVILYPDLPPTWDLIQPCINEKKYLFHLSAIRPTIDIMLPNAEPSPEWSDRLPAGYYHALPLFLQFLLSQCILPPRSTKIAQMFGTQRKDKIPASRCHAAGWALKMLRNLLLYVLAESSSKWRLIIMVWSLSPNRHVIVFPHTSDHVTHLRYEWFQFLWRFRTFCFRLAALCPK